MLSLGIGQKFLGHHRNARIDTESNTKRLATGKRINDFSDDAGAANLASRMTIRSIGLKQSTRNIDEALNAASMTDDGMQDVVHLLTKMKELAIQAASGTLSDTDRSHLQNEFSLLREEMNRFSIGHTYNDTINLLANENIMQIGFVIDTSGSMGGEINNLKNGILNGASSFASLLTNLSYNAQFGLSILSGDHDGARTLVPFSETANFSGALSAMPFPSAVSGMDPFAAMIQVIGADNSVVGNDPNDSFGFSDQALKHIILVTDTGREADQLDSTAVPNDNSAGRNSTAKTIGQLLASQGVTLHVMGGSPPLGVMAGQTGGTQQGMSSNGSNVTTLLDNIFDDIVANADANPEGKPAIIQAGEDVHDKLNASIAGFTVPAGLGLDLLSVETQSGADSAISVLDAAIDNVSEQRAAVAASTNQLIAERSKVVNEYTEMTSTSATIENADMADVSVGMVNSSLRSDTALQSMRSWFTFRAEQIQSLLS